jgi:hypothetical protein
VYIHIFVYGMNCVLCVFFCVVCVVFVYCVLVCLVYTRVICALCACVVGVCVPCGFVCAHMCCVCVDGLEGCWGEAWNLLGSAMSHMRWASSAAMTHCAGKHPPKYLCPTLKGGKMNLWPLPMRPLTNPGRLG